MLKHHPDKRRAAGEVITEDDDYFTNITKAYEILGAKSKRIAYDSVDPKFDNEIPQVSDKNKKNFYKVSKNHILSTAQINGISSSRAFL